jgi:hypothetical protein
LYGLRERHKKSPIYSILFDLLKHVPPEIVTRDDLKRLASVILQHSRPPKDRVRDIVRIVFANGLESLFPNDLAIIPELKQILSPIELYRILNVLSR